MSTATVVYPVYIRIVYRRGGEWHFLKGEPFVNLFNCPLLEQKDLFAAFGLSLKEVSVELFRINAGMAGYYLADIKDKKYYYCGQNWEDVKVKLLDIGIGKRDNP
ncbi:hypothetical protein DSM106972_044860 [Dulcicalothrix desertica PCC 7102]|uniref:Uncharacterized protein n=1 Tax=Dulcicalothrix desertica PCC 7102 TaxID=232991 RepID=A0A433VDU4_9CYAN|nr:hypothetical protein [Dulcicalothrix desertica]RUT04258.1 hypothetical protein DSM106972_044860 [Dulcicalothrix desertica PCC 7102]TWH38856.1 hypothetical protein CAL7102_08043 [Dulcicalothrix desertica PCC 7102]